MSEPAHRHVIRPRLARTIIRAPGSPFPRGESHRGRENRARSSRDFRSIASERLRHRRSE